jgi:hypothetical protein
MRRMSRSSILSVVVAIAVAAWASAAVSPAPASASQTGTIPARWEVFAAGPHERSLEARVYWGGCQLPDFHTTVLETPTTVEIGMLEAVPIPTSPEQACPDIELFGALAIPLAAPLAGRRFEAVAVPEAEAEAAGPLPTPIESPRLLPQATCSRVPDDNATPRLVGFAPTDARHILELCGLRVRFRPTHAHHGLPHVIAQAPAAGALVALDGIVTLRISA